MRFGGFAGLVMKAARRAVGAQGVDGRADIRLLENSELFDRDFYLSAYPDVAKSGIDPIEHYARFGASERRNPSRKFDTAHYLASNSDVERSGINPLAHFVLYGAKEGRAPLPVARQGQGGVASASADEHDTVFREILASGCFDETFYLGQAEGLIDAGEDALRHYISVGALAGMKPNEWFDSSFYLGMCRDVEESGVNPFHQFLKFGWRELRSPSSQVDAAWLLLFNEELRSGRTEVPLFLKECWSSRSFDNRPVGTYSQNDKVRLVNAISSFIAEESADHRTMYALGKLAEKIGALGLARDGYCAALKKSPEHHRYLHAVCEVNRNLGNWNEYDAGLEKMLETVPDSPEYLYKVGVARYRTGNLIASRTALERSLRIKHDENTAYQLGLVCSDLGLEKDADLAFAVALRLSKLGATKKALGPGALHEARADYVRAAEAFERLLRNEPMNAELHYRSGHCHERMYQWERADRAYRRAALLASGYGNAGWHFRIGFVNERMGRLDLAAISYRAAIHLASKRVPEWEYRLGYVLESMGQLEAASEAYLGAGLVTQSKEVPVNAIPHDAARVGASSVLASDDLEGYFSQFVDDTSGDASSPNEQQPPAAESIVDELLAAGDAHARNGDWVGAASSYESAAARDDDQNPLAYEKAGEAFLRAGMPVDAAKSLRLTRLLRRPYGVGVAATEDNRASLLGAAYLEYMSDLPILENVVMYESFSGLSMACNPLAIFRHLIIDPEFDGFTHVWVINDRSRIPDEFARRSDVVFISRDSFAYVKYLATAKFLINNSGFPGYFVRRPGQKYLATWHGTPLKTLGKEQKYKFYDHKRTQRNFLHATHIISPNAHSTRVQLDSYDIRSLYGGLFAETGYPRIDLTLNADTETRAKLRERLSLDEGRKVVLYAPTWRGTPDEVWFDFSRLQNDLEEMAKLDCQVIFRGHSWLERAINAADVQCNVVPADVDTNELLSIVDVLVTDYSSVFFDFFATGKPVVYYIYDVEDYTRDRGLYFDMDELPGIKCRDQAELSDGVRHALTLGIDHEKYDGDFNPHDDGSATRRVVGFFFHDSARNALRKNTPARKRVLIYAGTFEPGRETQLAVQLANALNAANFELVFTFTPTAVEFTAGAVERFQQLPSQVMVLPRYGHVLMNPEERWLRRKQEEGRLPESDECTRIVRGVYTRELYRMAGDSAFDAVVVFAGSGAFWPRLLLDGRQGGRAVVVTDDGAWQGLTSDVMNVSYGELSRRGVTMLASLLSSEG